MIRLAMLWAKALLLTSAFLVSQIRAEALSVIEGITFWSQPAEVFVGLDEVVRLLHWEVRREGNLARTINGSPLTDRSSRSLTDGTALVSLSGLQAAGASVRGEPHGATWTVVCEQGSLTVQTGSKKVEIDLKSQRLDAWQGNRLVLHTRISSGRNGRTPSGQYQAGPYRSRMHYSNRYHHAPMPWSVQINGHIFIHGFSEVPSYPASHGCIRLPLDEGNPAKFFYEWVDDGTPVLVKRD